MGDGSVALMLLAMFVPLLTIVAIRHHRKADANAV
jgi:hypothetical protein